MHRNTRALNFMRGGGGGGGGEELEKNNLDLSSLYFWHGDL